MIIASTAPGLDDLVSSQLGFAASGPYPPAARAGTLGTDEMRVYAADPAGLLPGEGCGVVILVRSADARAAGVPVYAEIAGWNAVPAGPPELAGLATQVTRPVLFAQAMAQAARAADLIVIAGPDAGLADRAAECGGMPAVAIPASRGVLAWPGVPAGDGRGPRSGRPGPGPDRPGPGQMALAEAIAAL